MSLRGPALPAVTGGSTPSPAHLSTQDRVVSMGAVSGARSWRVPSEAPRPAPDHLPAVVLLPPWPGRPAAVFLEGEGPAPGREAEGCECN